MKPAKPLSVENALISMERLCVRSEQCTSEIRRKLLLKGLSHSDAEKVVDSLVSRRFVDDNRFADAFVRDKYRFARWGRRKIAAAMYNKQLARSIIDRALREAIVDDEYDSIMTDLLKAKARMITEGDTYEGRTKLYRFGVSRGYEPDRVAKLIRSHTLWPGVQD